MPAAPIGDAKRWHRWHASVPDDTRCANVFNGWGEFVAPSTQSSRSGGIRFGIIVLIVATVAFFLTVGAQPETWRGVVRFVRDAELEEAVDYLRGFGGWTVVIVLALFVVEALIAPLPTWFLMIINGMLFGPWIGALVSFIGVLLGAMAAFTIARWVARRFIRGLIPDGLLERVDDFSRRNGFAVLFLLRLVPFTSSDLWSYVAGLSRIPVTHFLAATGLGDLPGVLLFSFLGEAVIENPAYRRWTLIAAGVLVVLFAGYKLYEHATKGAVTPARAKKTDDEEK